MIDVPVTNSGIQIRSATKPVSTGNTHDTWGACMDPGRDRRYYPGQPVAGSSWRGHGHGLVVHAGKDRGRAPAFPGRRVELAAHCGLRAAHSDLGQRRTRRMSTTRTCIGLIRGASSACRCTVSPVVSLAFRSLAHAHSAGDEMAEHPASGRCAEGRQLGKPQSRYGDSVPPEADGGPGGPRGGRAFGSSHLVVHAPKHWRGQLGPLGAALLKPVTIPTRTGYSFLQSTGEVASHVERLGEREIFHGQRESTVDGR